MNTTHTGEPMASCPMASMCKGMSERPPPLAILMIPGLVLIAIGIVIFLEPKVLVWLVAIVAIFLGIFLLAGAAWIRRVMAQFGQATP